MLSVTESVQAARLHTSAGLRVHHLHLVPCHSIFLGGDPLKDDNWLRLKHQRVSGEIRCYLEHIREAICSLQDKDSLLVFSGGKTRDRHMSESASYERAAQALGLLDDPTVLEKVVLEEFARDSLENLLFGLCRFYEVVGFLPHHVRVFGYDFKRERFELHARSLGLPPGAFTYVGVNDPPDLASAEAGEGRALASFRADPYGQTGNLLGKRLERSAYGHRPPYEFTCRFSARLRKRLWVNGGAPPDKLCKTYVIYTRGQTGAVWKPIDAAATGLLVSRLHDLDYRREPDILEQQQPAHEQVEDPFEHIPDDRWIGTEDDYCFLRTVDLLLTTTRPPLDEDGKKTVRRTHTRLERKLLRLFRRFFTNCSRKNITLAPRFAALFHQDRTAYAEIDFNVFDTREDDQKEVADFMADFRALSGNQSHRKIFKEHCGRTCCYLVWAGADNAIGCPVLAAFGLSGSDTFRFATALTQTRLGEVFENVVSATGHRDRLVMVECSRPDPDAPCDFEVIFDEVL